LNVACAQKDFSGSGSGAQSSDTNVAAGDGQVALPPIGNAQSLTLSDLCILTSPDYADGFANYAALTTSQDCLAYGLKIHEIHYQLYETEVRYLPRAQVESLVKQAAGVETISASTTISMRTFLNLVKTNTTPLAVHPTFY
jgi:hypothetical protein